jgi:signal transduction histidine kinase
MQNLTVIGLGLGDLRRRLRALVPADHQAGIDASMEQIAAELGRVEHDLRALIAALEHGGATSVLVVDAVELEIEEFKRRSTVAPELIVLGDVRTETDSQRIALQSITRSALANVAKHAGATSVTVRLVGALDSVRLEIEDDGCGFDPSHPPKKGHFGLNGMRERVAMLGGTFDVQSREGGPTKITATLETWRPPAAA